MKPKVCVCARIREFLSFSKGTPPYFHNDWMNDWVWRRVYILYILQTPVRYLFIPCSHPPPFQAHPSPPPVPSHQPRDESCYAFHCQVRFLRPPPLKLDLFVWFLVFFFLPSPTCLLRNLPSSYHHSPCFLRPLISMSPLNPFSLLIPPVYVLLRYPKNLLFAGSNIESCVLYCFNWMGTWLASLAVDAKRPKCSL